MRTDKLASIIIISVLLSGCAAQSPILDEATTIEPIRIELGKMQPTTFTPELSSAFSTPWPTGISREELVNTALYKSFEYFDSIKQSDCSISAKTFGGDPLPTEHVEILETISDNMTLVFCNYLKKDFYVIGGSSEFVKTTIKNEQISNDFYKGCGQALDLPFSACSFAQVAYTRDIGGTNDGQVFVEDRKLTIAAHEVFHVIHDQIDPDPGGQVPPRGQDFFRPLWFIEGGGEYFGRLMPYYFRMISSYGTFAPTDRSGMFLSKDYLGDLEAMEVSRNIAFGTENYYSGQVALEYIIANNGMEALLNVWVGMGNGKSFDEAFHSSIGLTTKEFYSKFKEMHDGLYDGDLVTN
jgi:hypothetical protein